MRGALSSPLSLLAVLLATSSAIHAQTFEVITSKDGRRIEGEVIAPMPDHLQVRRSDGKFVDIPWEMLEDVDQAKYRTMGAVITKFDRFLSANTIKLVEPIKLDGETGLGISIHSLTTSETREDRVCLRWTRVADESEWFKYHAVMLLLDGVRWLPESDIDADVFASGKVYESVTVWCGPEDLKKLVHASQVEMRVGRREYTLDQIQRWFVAAVATKWVESGGDSLVTKP